MCDLVTGSVSASACDSVALRRKVDARPPGGAKSH